MNFSSLQHSFFGIPIDWLTVAKSRYDLNTPYYLAFPLQSSTFVAHFAIRLHARFPYYLQNQAAIADKVFYQ